MSKAAIEKIVKKYTEKLSENNYRFTSVFLFGSHVKDKANENSDIDVAIVTNIRDTEKNRSILWRFTWDVDTRIEPHFFKEKDFNDEQNIIACEIKRTGIKIA